MSHLFTGHWSKHVTWSSPKSMRMYVLFTGHEGVNNSNSMENGAIESTQAGIFSSRREGNWKLYYKGFRENMGDVKVAENMWAEGFYGFTLPHGSVTEATQPRT